MIESSHPVIIAHHSKSSIRAITNRLHEFGYTNILEVSDLEACKKELKRYPKALLLLDLHFTARFGAEKISQTIIKAKNQIILLIAASEAKTRKLKALLVNKRYLTIPLKKNEWMEITESKKEQKKITEKHPDEENLLSDRKKQLAAFNKNLREGIFRLQHDGELLYENPALYNIYHIPAEETDRFAFYRLNKAKWDLLFKRLRKERVIENYEVLMQRTDGTEFWAFLNCAGIVNPRGKVVYIDGAVNDITDKKEYDIKLHESEIRNRALLEALPDLIFIYDYNGTYLDYHAGDPARLVLPPDNVLIGKNVMEVLPPVVATLFINAFKKIRSTRKSEVIYYPLTANGTAFIFEARIVYLDENRVMTIVRDNTDKINADKTIFDKEKRYRAFVSQSSEAIWCFELDAPMDLHIPVDEQINTIYHHSFISECNLEYVRSHGRQTVEEMLGLRTDQLPDLPESEFVSIIRVFIKQNYKLENTETLLADSNGNKSYYFSNFIGIINDESLERIWCTKREITSLKNTQLALQQAENKFRSIFENSLEGIYQSLPSGRFISVNPALAQMFGFRNPEEMIVSITDISSEIYAEPEVRRKFIDTLYQTGNIKAFETRAVKQDKTIFWISENARLLRNEQDEITHIEGIIEDITHRKQVEESLWESEIRYRDLINLSPDGIVVHVNGRIVFVNTSGLQLIGARHENEVIGKNPMEFVHPHSRAIVQERIRLMVEEKQHVPILEEKFVRLDGSSYFVEVAAAPFQWNGKSAVQLIVRDITERKIHDFINKREATIFSMLAGNEPLVNILNEICFLNENIQPDSKCAVYEVDEKTISLLTAPNIDPVFLRATNIIENTPGLQGIIHAAAWGKMPIYISNILIDRRWPDYQELSRAFGLKGCWALPLRDSRRQVVGVFAFYFNCQHEPSVAEEQIINRFANVAALAIEKRRLEQEIFRLSLVARQTTNSVLLLDTEFKILWVNEGFTRLTGYTLNDVFGNQPQEFLVHNLEDTGVTPQIIRELHEGIPAQFRNYNYRRDGSGYWVNSAIDCMRDDAGIVLGYIVIETDISDLVAKENALRDAKEKAEEANRLKSSFLANMSHEIRTPMNGILGFADILRDELLNMGEQELYKFSETIYNSGKRLLNLLNDILDLSRIEADKLELELTPCIINDSILKVITLLKPLAERKGIELIYNRQEPVKVLADETRLFQILNNVIGNAIKFTSEGWVHVKANYRTGASFDEAVVTVTDTGSGIDENFLPHIFEPFMQESTGFSRAHEGTGLGLAISHRLVSLMNGNLAIESTKNAGTKVTLSFRTIREDEFDFSDSEATKISIDKLEQLRKLFPKILIVEDDQTTQSFFRQVLTQYTDVHIVSAGEEALDWIRTCHERNEYPALVLMDIGLPSPWDGVKLRQHILEEYPDFAAIPIVAQTAYAMKGEQEMLEREGFTGILAKPFSKNELLASILSYILP